MPRSAIPPGRAYSPPRRGGETSLSLQGNRGISPSLRAERSNLHPVSHSDGDCAYDPGLGPWLGLGIDTLLAITGQPPVVSVR